MIFIGYKDNGYYFMYYTWGNIIFCSIHTIFDEELFPKYTDFHTKEHKLYNILLNKISLETELSVPDLSGKDESAPVPILYTPISSIQNNPPTHSSLLSLSYKSLFSSPISRSKKSTVEIEKNDNVNYATTQPLTIFVTYYANTTRRFWIEI